LTESNSAADSEPRTEVLVIGAGVIGLCSAYYLAQRGCRVTVVERNAICDGCSCGNAGLVVPSHSMPLAAPGVPSQALRWMIDPASPFYIKPRLDLDLVRWLWAFGRAANQHTVRAAIPVLRDLQRASRDLFAELAASGFEFGYVQNGLLALFRTADGFAHGAAEAAMLREYGLASEVLPPEEVFASLSAAAGGIAGGVRHFEDAHVDPAAFVAGLARQVEASGVGVLTSTEVLGFETANSPSTGSGRRAGHRSVRRVRTNRGDFEPLQVVLAAGSWSPGVAADLGLYLPIQAAKGYSITVPRPKGYPDFPLFLSEARVAVTPMGATLRFAGTLELAGLDRTVNQRRVGAIRRATRAYLPGIGDWEADGATEDVWAGLRPCSPDGLPLIGRVPRYSNLVVAAGHATLGLSLGPVTGKLVSQVVLGETPAFGMAALSPNRFE
jgi:D-amino-acid dehydrogenase